MMYTIIVSIITKHREGINGHLGGHDNWTTTYAQLLVFMTIMVHANPDSIVEINVVRHNSENNRSSISKRIFL